MDSKKLPSKVSHTSKTRELSLISKSSNTKNSTDIPETVDSNNRLLGKPRPSYLSLPLELRQHVLLQTLNLAGQKLIPILLISIFDWECVLRLVGPQVALDLEWVHIQWLNNFDLKSEKECLSLDAKMKREERIKKIAKK